MKEGKQQQQQQQQPQQQQQHRQSPQEDEAADDFDLNEALNLPLERSDTLFDNAKTVSEVCFPYFPIRIQKRLREEAGVRARRAGEHPRGGDTDAEEVSERFYQIIHQTM